MPSNDRQIMKLMEAIHNGSIQLPEFQRDWVWDDRRIKALISSVIHQFPIGAVMFLQYGNAESKFQHRPLEGSPESNKAIVPKELILDGQQRLTSLYCSLYSENPVRIKKDAKEALNRYYYIDIEKVLSPNADDQDDDQIILSVPAEKKILPPNAWQKESIDLSTPEKEYENKIFPLNLILNPQKMWKWQVAYHNYYAGNSYALTLFDGFVGKIIMGVQGYEMPVISLAENTPREAVCRVFENVNTGGMMLTVFELVTATFAIEDFNLRADWNKRKEVHFQGDILTSLTETDFLMALTLFASWKKKDKSVSCKKGRVLQLPLADYKAYANPLTKGFREAEKLLGEECIFSAKDLPYSTQLIPMAAICTALESKIHTAIVRNKIKQWYWCGVFGELYGSANESRFALDMTQVVEWVNGGNPPKTCQEASFRPVRLLSMRTRSSAAYKGIMALIMKNGSMDFLSGSRMDHSAVYKDENIDIHHIFPQNYCQKKNLPKDKWQSIINKTPLSSKANRAIGGIAPSKYLYKILKEQKVSEADLTRFLESHWINPSCCWNDDFDQFVINRARKLLDAIEKAIVRDIPGRDSQEVILAFGDKLT